MCICIYFLCVHILFALGYNKYIPAPAMIPSCCVHRPVMMKQLVDAVLSDLFDPNCTTVCATVHGDQGCGKSTLVNALCHQREIKEHFKDGFLFIQLGTHPDTCTKLSQLYHLLTNKELKAKEDTGNMDIVISELRHVTAFYFRYLLVIIEDLWDITDIEPYLSAFSNCKVVVTTQDSSLVTDIPSSTYIEVAHMEKREALSMLYKGIVDISIQLPKESVKCLENLVVDLRLWPMYLYLVRGQIIHHMKFQKMQFPDALEMVTRKLSNCGLGIYADNEQRLNRKHAEKPCIECTIQMLDDTERNRLLSVIFYAGVRHPLPKPVVERIWEISAVNASKLFTKLEHCSIFLCSDIYTAPSNVELTCIQVHPIIAQHVLDNTDSLRVIQMWPLKSLMLPLIHDELQLSFPQYSEDDRSDVEEYLKDTCKRLDHRWLAENVMYLTRGAFYDPHFIIYQLKCLQLRIRGRPDLVPDETVRLITDECVKVLKGLPRKLSMFNRKFDRLLFENDYDGLIDLFDKTCTDTAVAKAAEKCVRLFESVAEYCHNVILDWINDARQQLQLLLSQYHENTLLILPQAKLYIELRKDIIEALVSDTRKWPSLSKFVKSELKERLAAIECDCKNKTQEVSSKHIHQKLKRAL